MKFAQCDTTHDGSRQSWVDSANIETTDFPLQNLPYGRFLHPHLRDWRLGVAIGEEVLDLRAARAAGLPLDSALELDDLSLFMAQGLGVRQLCRRTIFDALSVSSSMTDRLRSCLVPQAGLEMGLPCKIQDYTDFFTGIHHAREAGKLSRPEAPLPPNYKWVPIAYHGRSSSIIVSGTPIRRPHGQILNDQAKVQYVPTRRFDYELEVGVFIGASNSLGRRVDIDNANDHWFGLVLLNDWSARDVQRWESQPLGPFLAKNFATSISPWVVTQEALAPYRVPAAPRAAGDPAVLPHLFSEPDSLAGGIDLKLEAWVQTSSMEAPERLTSCAFKDSAYWTVAQMIAHHTSNGCNLNAGDLLGTGTQSGAGAFDGGCLLELTEGGKRSIQLVNGESRTFLEDGDKVILRGYCDRPGFRRIGLGSCSGVVLPASNSY